MTVYNNNNNYKRTEVNGIQQNNKPDCHKNRDKW